MFLLRPATYWRHAVEYLALDARCIVPDFLGLGATEAHEAQDLGAGAQTQIVIALLDALGLKRVHVVASDSGGAVGQLLAAQVHPSGPTRAPPGAQAERPEG